MLCCSGVNAAGEDVFKPYAEYSMSYDDNLLRLHDRADAIARFGDDKMSDSYTRQVGGMKVDKIWGRQRLMLDVSANRNHFDHFNQYDYVGKDGQAKWNWVLGNRLQGNLSTVYGQTLTPFQDFRVFERNVRTQRTNSVDLAWLLHPSWRLRTAYSRYNLNYSAASQAANNLKADTAEAGVDYLARSGSSVGMLFRHLRGSYANMQVIGADQFNNNYTQKEAKVSVDWLVTGRSRLQFLGGPVQRKRDFFTARDYSGFNARLTAYLQPTGKLAVAGSVWRELGALDDLTANYALTDGASLTAALDISSKLRLDGTTTYQRRNYNGAQVIAGLTPSDRQDRYQRTSLSLTYRPIPALSFVTSFYRELLNSNLTPFSYRANGVSLTTRYEF